MRFHENNVQSGTRTYTVNDKEITVDYEVSGGCKTDVYNSSGQKFLEDYMTAKVTVPAGYEDIGFYIAYADLDTMEADKTIKDTLDQTLNWDYEAFFFTPADYDENYNSENGGTDSTTWWYD